MKLIALDYLVHHAPETDSLFSHIDSLFMTIDSAVGHWNKSPWKNLYDREEFCEYVLPYRVSCEPAEYYWRWHIPTWQSLYVSETESVVDVARRINNNIEVKTSPTAFGNPLLGYSKTVAGRIGKCDDRAILTVMALRSYGIPSAFEIIPYWGDNNNGHSICSAILPDQSILAFQNPTDEGEKALFSNKVPKIYRHMFSLQKNTALYKYRDREEIPPVFADFNLMDVTDKHNIDCKNLKVNLNKNASGHKIAYLAVFSPSDWMPVAYAECKGESALFRAVGTGIEKANMESLAENSGKGILYLPCIHKEDEVRPVGYPFILSDSSRRELRPDTSVKENIVLLRKYPRKPRIVVFADQMRGGTFEGANNPDFSDSEELFYVIETPLSRMQRIELNPSKKFRYVRYRKSGILSIGEMKFYDNDNLPSAGNIISCDPLKNVPEFQYVHDGHTLTYLSFSGLKNGWIGLDFKRPISITSLEFCPRTDDNDINPGDLYELLYWDDAWISLGQRYADSYELQWKGVPKDALLWLRNLTCGREERPFTYEDGVQIWW